jgi:Putative glycosyl/glycerophosphate transferases involved in teichoic acid biosynthesis TagF/TagB/EpsJ/RodC
MVKNVRFILKQYVKMLIQNVLMPVVYIIFSFRKIDNNLIVFADAHNDMLPSSMKLLYDEVSVKGYKVVCNICDYRTCGTIKMLKNMITFMWYYSIARCVFICDYYLPASACKKRKGTRLIQLWHAPCGISKKFGYSTNEDIPRYYKGLVTKNYDIVPVSSEVCVPIYTEAFRLTLGSARAIGVSRTDVFFDLNYKINCKNKFYVKYPELKSKKLILWAPTFRGNAANPYVVGYNDIKKVQKLLGDEWYIIIKLHPHVKGIAENCEISVEKLYPVIDILITDYSSVIYEYLLFDKPYIIYVPDYETYMKNRGSYIDYRVIFKEKIVINADDLHSKIIEFYKNFDINENETLKKYFMEACDGNSTKRLLKMLNLE